MNEEFVNAYIERVVNEVAELTKTRLLLETQLTLAKKANEELTIKIKKLETQLDSSKLAKKKDDF